MWPSRRPSRSSCSTQSGRTRHGSCGSPKAIDTGTSEFSVDAVRVDNQCPFGQWLHGSISAEARRSPSYEQVRGLHASFHRLAAEVLRLALAGRVAEARQAMEIGGDFNRTSSQLTLALTAWQESLGRTSST